ncbi:MAG: rod shape-determining protein [Desulfobacula sp.]|jgi:rod shape-determining protein MreB and related proteins|uniref:rod shape-determining protein n=1 Tax=Desulfobacula sp. TaxID=2593537 RepID=UPI002A13B357|nr:rod shape-determining protein [Desulfobacula sp.]MBT7794500.1 rod shape-determining protein [Desulfobacula sp.]
MYILNPFHIDLGIDLGTANTIIYAKKRGFICNEASYIALNQDNKTIALGNHAKKMMGKTPLSIKVVRPLIAGVISDFDAGDAFIKGFIKQAKISKIRIGRIIMGVPTQASAVEKMAMIKSAIHAGAKKVYLIAEPMAAAIGLNQDVMGGSANMVVDIGGGTTDIAVVNYGGIVVDNTIRIAGDDIDQAIISYINRKYKIKIGVVTAEKLKTKFLNLTETTNTEVFIFKSLDLIKGKARKYEFPVEIFKESVKEIIDEIINAILHVLEILPAELSSDIINNGITLTGGGSQLPGLDSKIEKATGVTVHVADNPLFSVANGIKKILHDLQYYNKIILSSS